MFADLDLTLDLNLVSVKFLKYWSVFFFFQVFFTKFTVRTTKIHKIRQTCKTVLRFLSKITIVG